MRTWLCTIALLTAVPAFAQHPHQGVLNNPQGHAQAEQGHSPYAESKIQGRTIKALSEQQLADLRAGKGMSLALPAELNGYPGPSHTLEHASALGLNETQIARTKALFDAMQREAEATGEKLIDAEKKLDDLFKLKRASLESIQLLTANAARLQGELRSTHLRYHLAMTRVLTSAQISRYNKLRGYQ